jgi:hypothetical protein
MTREVRGLLNNASNEGSDVQRRQHRQHLPRSMQYFRAEFTIPQSVGACPRRRSRLALLATRRRHRKKPTVAWCHSAPHL